MASPHAAVVAEVSGNALKKGCGVQPKESNVLPDQGKKEGENSQNMAARRRRWSWGVSTMMQRLPLTPYIQNSACKSDAKRAGAGKKLFKCLSSN
jgi:hypothetical protein